MHSVQHRSVPSRSKQPGLLSEVGGGRVPERHPRDISDTCRRMVLLIPTICDNLSIQPFACCALSSLTVDSTAPDTLSFGFYTTGGQEIASRRSQEIARNRGQQSNHRLKKFISRTVFQESRSRIVFENPGQEWTSRIQIKNGREESRSRIVFVNNPGQESSLKNPVVKKSFLSFQESFFVRIQPRRKS